MMARRKIILINSNNSNFDESRISRAEGAERLRSVMEKDRHLIEAALASEGRVVSLDEEVRVQFRAHSDRLPEVRPICWVNPSRSEEAACDWLKSGAPVEQFRTLGFVKAPE